ncbi:S8 family peptidase [Pararhizobium sp.]|uniref:S8 family peptidase n=1 Tax=Pararhizobium sp. TaxID=1977563 RepID=UPI002727876B|nr:S8 family serine peptidase [Pararhizobium sp.]MDO9417186.1 S8 family serine peptidase [Pararhizobium sp.]
MKTVVWQLQPVEFVKALEMQTQIWRKSVRTASAGARRHLRDLRRDWIRTYKKRSGNQRLPAGLLARPQSDVWLTGSETDPKLVIPPKAELSALGKPRRLRHDLRKLLHASFADKPNYSIDLVNAANSSARRLPSLGHLYEDSRLKIRGIFLEALGAAILPDLQPNDVKRLEAQGATVLSNTELIFELPLNEGPVAGGELFWHRTGLPLGADGQPLFTGKGVSIGVLDTGVDANHPEFFGKAIPFCAFDQFGQPMLAIRSRDFHHHGTHVSGICVGLNAGIAPDAHLSVAAVLMPRANNRASGTVVQIVAGLNWLARSAGPHGDGVDIINASLGFEGMPDDEARGLYNLLQTIREDEGTLVVAAIGNHGKKGAGHHGAPARFSNVLAVGAVDHHNRIADFSAWGESTSFPASRADGKPNLVAPGVSINSCVPDGRYARTSGTSMASPIVSAAAALLIEADRTLCRKPDRLTQRLLGLTSHYSHWTSLDLPRAGEGHLDLAKLR